MTIHHSKHHATYVANLNVALEKAEKAANVGDVNTLIALAPAVSCFVLSFGFLGRGVFFLHVQSFLILFERPFLGDNEFYNISKQD